MNYSQTLTKLIDRHDLPFAEMRELMEHIMSGQLTPAQIAAVLIALRMKGETVDEIAASAAVMRELSTKVNVKHTGHLVDTCGTGGDGAQTFNISSTCGSADVLEKLGVNVNLTPEQVAQCVDNIGVGFMFAPHHHSAMKHAAPVRRELGVRTMFNLLGPLTNPAGAQNQVIGVFHQSLTTKLAQVLASLGSRHVLVVHGADGMDEISISDGTYIAELKDGKVSEYTVHPDLFGLASAPGNSLRVANPDQACEKLLGVLNNEVGVPRDIVQLNAGAAIYVAGLSGTLEEGVAKADEVIDSGAAKTRLDQLIALSNSFKA